MNSKSEKFSFSASLRSNYEWLLKKIQETPDVVNKQSFRLEVAGLLGGVKIAEESEMDSAEVKLIRTGVEQILKKLPEKFHTEINQLTKDPETKSQINGLTGKKNIPSWLGGHAS